MATNGVVAGGIAQHTLQRLEHIIGKFRQVPVRVWRGLCLAAFALWLCYSFSQLFWLVMPEPDIPEPPLSVAANTAFAEQPVTETGGDVDIEALKDLSLFGEGKPEETAVAKLPGIEQEAVETSLQLVLHGAVPSSNPERAKAIIGDGGKQEGFSPGEELSLGPRGVKLAKVMNDRVVLDNNGRYETLWLYDNEGAGQASSRRSGQSAQPTTTRRPIQTRSRRTSRPADSGSGDDAQEFVGALLPEGEQQSPSAEQVRMVTDVLNVSMHREGGQLIGFRIRPKGDRQLFEELGLEPNDVVTAVNNVGLDDTSRAMEVYRSLGQESRATLEILRDGTTITVDVALNQ